MPKRPKRAATERCGYAETGDPKVACTCGSCHLQWRGVVDGPDGYMLVDRREAESRLASVSALGRDLHARLQEARAEAARLDGEADDLAAALRTLMRSIEDGGSARRYADALRRAERALDLIEEAE